MILLWSAVDEIYLVAQALAGNDGHLIAKLLVDLEVKGELGVVTLNDDLGGPLDGLCANATHFGGVWLLLSGEVRRRLSVVVERSRKSRRGDGELRAADGNFFWLGRQSNCGG